MLELLFNEADDEEFRFKRDFSLIGEADYTYLFIIFNRKFIFSVDTIIAL